MITIPRDKLDDVWRAHIKVIAGSRNNMALSMLQRKVEEIADSIEQNEKLRIDMTRMLFDRQWIETSHPFWEGIRIIMSKGKTEDAEFLGHVEANLTRIEFVDPSLASMIK